MSDQKYDFSESEALRDLSGQARYRGRDYGPESAPGLKFSSPWPWVRAMALSCVLWAFIAWLILSML